MAVRIDTRVIPRAHYLSALVSGLVAVDRELIADLSLPSLYTTKVVYRREGRGFERWQTADEVIRSGSGDCEDLASYRAAELQLAGEDAEAIVYRTMRRTFHVVVRREDGSIDDPSRVLKHLERVRAQYRGKT